MSTMPNATTGIHEIYRQVVNSESQCLWHAGIYAGHHKAMMSERQRRDDHSENFLRFDAFMWNSVHAFIFSGNRSAWYDSIKKISGYLLRFDDLFALFYQSKSLLTYLCTVGRSITFFIKFYINRILFVIYISFNKKRFHQCEWYKCTKRTS